ncbi:MAG: hemerythrin domain-containing protein [Pirellulales bacterium]|nr:hemerythrin domain-containing protein [Pirellulales bacterium]
MDAISIAEQALVEHRILQHVKAALRLCLDWQASEVGLNRKISSVRFTAQSLQRHLERMMGLEEDGGYMDAVREQKPNWTTKVEGLAEDHAQIRRRLAEVMPSLEGEDAHDSDRFTDVCERLAVLLALLDEHDQKEIDLLMEVFTEDLGGEG